MFTNSAWVKIKGICTDKIKSDLWGKSKLLGKQRWSLNLGQGQWTCFGPPETFRAAMGTTKNLFEERWHFVLRSWGHSWGMAGLKGRKGWIPLSPPIPDSLLQPYESKRELTDRGKLASETIPPKAIAVLRKCSDGVQGAVLILWTKPEWFRQARKRPKEWQKYYWWKVHPGGKPILNAFASSNTVILLGSLLSCSNGMLSFFRCHCLVAGQGEQQLPSASARLLS